MGTGERFNPSYETSAIIQDVETVIQNAGLRADPERDRLSKEFDITVAVDRRGIRFDVGDV